MNEEVCATVNPQVFMEWIKISKKQGFTWIILTKEWVLLGSLCPNMHFSHPKWSRLFRSGDGAKRGSSRPKYLGRGGLRVGKSLENRALGKGREDHGDGYAGLGAAEWKRSEICYLCSTHLISLRSLEIFFWLKQKNKTFGFHFFQSLVRPEWFSWTTVMQGVSFRFRTKHLMYQNLIEVSSIFR